MTMIKSESRILPIRITPKEIANAFIQSEASDFLFVCLNISSAVLETPHEINPPMIIQHKKVAKAPE